MRQGRVIPEAFDIATLYFSDIVGFMKINQSSTAYEVIRGSLYQRIINVSISFMMMMKELFHLKVAI